MQAELLRTPPLDDGAQERPFEPQGVAAGQLEQRQLDADAQLARRPVLANQQEERPRRDTTSRVVDAPLAVRWVRDVAQTECQQVKKWQK